MVQETGPATFKFDGEPLYHLFGAYTRYSSWTARVTTVLEYFRIPYKATYVNVTEVKHLSPSGLVPLLTPLTGPLKDYQLNDSLAILLHLAENHPELPFWPRDPKLRAIAQSAVAEMHAGFPNIRGFDSNFVGKYTGNVPVTDTDRKDIERVLKIFDNARTVTRQAVADGADAKDEGFLFGEFGIADAFYWPVLWRFRTYNLPLTTATRQTLEWFKRVWEDPIFVEIGNEYFAQADIEETALPQYDDLWKDDKSVDVTWGTIPRDWKFEL